MRRAITVLVLVLLVGCQGPAAAPEQPPAPAPQPVGPPPAPDPVVVPPEPAPARPIVQRPVDSSRYTDRFDEHLSKYSKQFFGPAFDWKWFKAQAIAESALNPDAVSPVGARGLIQIMPATAAEIQREQPWIQDPFHEAKWMVAAGIYYDSKMLKMWDARLRDENNRLALMLASYNAGAGNIQRCQKRCGGGPGCNSWGALRPIAPLETQGYVDRIFKLMSQNY